jgi:hypothetical protein
MVASKITTKYSQQDSSQHNLDNFSGENTAAMGPRKFLVEKIYAEETRTQREGRIGTSS